MEDAEKAREPKKRKTEDADDPDIESSDSFYSDDRSLQESEETGEPDLPSAMSTPDASEPCNGHEKYPLEHVRYKGILPRSNDTLFIREVRSKYARRFSATCMHPTCLQSKHSALFGHGKICLCGTHAPCPPIFENRCVDAGRPDLAPFALYDVHAVCTQFHLLYPTDSLYQFLFSCAMCGRVCAPCSKKCYAEGHALYDCKFTLGRCSSVKVVKVSNVRNITYNKKDADGAWITCETEFKI